jgi:type I restriction enzyme S subunit
MKLVDVCKTFTSGGTPSRKRPEFFENGTIPWVKTKELNDCVISEVEEYITDAAVKNSSAKVLPKNTVLLAMYGATVGKLGILGLESACNQACAAMVPKEGIVDFRFLYYLLMKHREEIIGLATGGAQQNLSGELIKGFTFDFPTFSEQMAISEVLWELDKKIENNTRISRTLEEIAQRIFKSWFVDFDPVKAKMSGEKPVGMDDATAALFPSSMEDSEVGPIPKGWAKTTIGDVLVKQKPGKLFDQKTTRSTGKIPVLDQGRSGVVGYHDDEPGYVASPENPVVVFANHTCSLRFISYPFSVIQNVFPILGNGMSTYWLYFALQGKQNFDSYKGHWPDLVIKSIVCPSSEVADAFGHVVGPLMKQVWNFDRQNRLLAEMRDGLLPRLISGELQIPEEMLVS